MSRSATPPSNTPKPSAASAECRRRIAFVGRTDGEKDIFVINADGSGLINVTNAAGNEKHASWSPDGTCLAFVSYHGGRSALYVMNANGGGLTKLADNADWGSQPSWSP